MQDRREAQVAPRMALDLLRLFDSLVTSDRAPAGFVGDICVVIKCEVGTMWWLVRSSAAAGIETFFPRRFPTYDAAIALDENAAAALESGIELPRNALCVKTGDERLLQKFLNRYFVRQNLLTFRCGLAAE